MVFLVKHTPSYLFWLIGQLAVIFKEFVPVFKFVPGSLLALSTRSWTVSLRVLKRIPLILDGCLLCLLQCVCLLWTDDLLNYLSFMVHGIVSHDLRLLLCSVVDWLFEELGASIILFALQIFILIGHLQFIANDPSCLIGSVGHSLDIFEIFAHFYGIECITCVQVRVHAFVELVIGFAILHHLLCLIIIN